MAGLVVSPLSTSAAQRGDRAGQMNRAQLEQRFRMRLANLLKTQLGLTDEGEKNNGRKRQKRMD